MRQTGDWKLLVVTVCALSLASPAGCRRGREPIAAPAVKPPIAIASPDAAASQASALSEPAASSQAAAEAGPTAESADPSQSVGSPKEQTPRFATERVLLFVAGRPLVVDLRLSIDGQPHTQALESLVDDVLKLGDADGDGRTTWKELCSSPRIKYGQYGSLPIDNENSERQIIERYDIARDGIADRSELPRFLTRNAGGSRSFSIRGTLDHRDLNRRGAPTWRIIDSDDDGVITDAERRAAPARLAGRDNDDDEIVLASDLNPRTQSTDPDMAMYERRRRGPDAARLLGNHADWGGVLAALEQHYGARRGLRPDSFPLTPELFAQLDQNHDGRVKREELTVLNELPADVVIAAEFGRAEGTRGGTEGGEQGTGEQGTGDREQETGDRGQATGDNDRAAARNQPRLTLVQVASLSPGDSLEVAPQPNRLLISAGGQRLLVYANDTVASDDFAARARQALDMLDQNKDGYLEKIEVPESLQGQLGRFEAVDADEDGKAYAHEIEAFLAQQQAGLRAQIHARASDSLDLLFVALDTNRDERLDSREIEAAPHRLATLDGNGDGQLRPDELPELLVLALARGSLETADATFAAPPAIARQVNQHLPRWFAAMDANADGVISRREFLGSAEQFAQLDGDANGLIEPAEVALAAPE